MESMGAEWLRKVPMALWTVVVILLGWGGGDPSYCLLPHWKQGRETHGPYFMVGRKGPGVSGMAPFKFFSTVFHDFHRF